MVFSKYLSELIVKRYAHNWIIIRLAGMVGEGMKKGAVYDLITRHKLFVSKQSRYQFIETKEVARISKILIERKRFGEIYNIVGKRNIELSKVARIFKVKLTSNGKDKYIFNVSTNKLEKEINLPTTIRTVKDFYNKIKSGSVRIYIQEP